MGMGGGWIKRLFRQMQHDGTVFANRIQHHGVFRLGNNLAHDVNGLGFKTGQMGLIHFHVCRLRFSDLFNKLPLLLFDLDLKFIK